MIDPKKVKYVPLVRRRAPLWQSFARMGLGGLIFSLGVHTFSKGFLFTGGLALAWGAGVFFWGVQSYVKD